MIKVEIDGWEELVLSQVCSWRSKDALRVEADGQVNIWMMCSSNLSHNGQLEEALCPRLFITRPVAISPPTNLEINLRMPNVVEVRLS